MDFEAHAITTQPDAKILAAGSTRSGNFVLARYETDGSRRDPSFGTAREGGYTVTPAGSKGGGAQDMELLPNGRILLSGYAINYHRQWKAMLTAYRPNGAPDERFGSGGIVEIKAKGETPIELRSVEARPSGRILAAGTIGGYVMVIALKPNGKADRRFGDGDGVVITDADGSKACDCARVTDMQIDRRGRIVVSANVAGPKRNREPAALIRYRPNGKLDRSFGRRGIVRTVLGTRLLGEALTIQHNGRLVLAGAYNVPGSGEAHLAVARYLPDGSLDRSFARQGFFIRDFGPEAVALAALTQRDGKVVVAGRARRELEPVDEAPSIYDTAQVFLVRFMP